MTTPLNLRRGLVVLIALGFQCFLVNAQKQQGISGMGAQRCAILTARLTAGTNPNDTTELLTWSVRDLDVGPAASSTEQPFLAEWCKSEPTRKVIEQTVHFTVEH
jgi:hypothetical protein